MIRLNLTATPEWLDLAPGLRLLVGPLTTALMVTEAEMSAMAAMMQDHMGGQHGGMPGMVQGMMDEN